ncbi:uncharacterized protein [Physcomitrium patens]|uniref:Uncharacterized protein n=1 Tax=Physcomitrium patens TaxID=3218 RepID=A0A7I4C9U1_PHYPA|nr:uncharacterized protein LOC112274800 [Physcomitrium patens]|eukprot:XP_024360337.1 uncharacterized protein LOC112274800 [Physcomitrella patens]
MTPSSDTCSASLSVRDHETHGITSESPSESAASTSVCSLCRADGSRDLKQGESKTSDRSGVFTLRFSIFSSVLSYVIKICGGYTPYVKQAERDIDKVADLVEAGASLVVKVAEDIEAMAHVAEISAQDAEKLALKVESKTKLVKQTLDAIADVLEGDRKLSTVLSGYATLKRQSALPAPPPA